MSKQFLCEKDQVEGFMSVYSSTIEAMMKQNYMVNTLIFYPYLDHNANYLIESDQLCMTSYTSKNYPIDLVCTLYQ